MEKEMYNYRKEVADDVKFLLTVDIDSHSEIKKAINNFQNNEIDFDELCDMLYDELFCLDSVTGNGSGSYTFNTEKAKKYVLENVALIIEMAKEFDYSLDDLYKKGYESVDVILRCYVLPEAIQKTAGELYCQK